MNSTAKQVVFWLVILLFGVLLWQVVHMSTNPMKDKDINFSEFMAAVNQGTVQDVTIDGQQVRGHYRDNKGGFRTTVQASYNDMTKALLDKGVQISVRDTTRRWLAYMAASVCPAHPDRRSVVLHAPADAVRRQQGVVVRQEPRAPALHAAEEGHLQRRGRRG